MARGSGTWASPATCLSHAAKGKDGIGIRAEDTSERSTQSEDGVTHPNALTALIVRCTAWLAGPERAEWSAAMAAETDAADEQRTSWALGCLWAALADRIVRECWYLLSLVGLPALAFLVVLPIGFVVAVSAAKIGISGAALVPIMLFGPLPCAWLLGRMRPSASATLVGTIGFLVHQSVPLLAMWILFDIRPASFWAANLTYYNLPPVIGLLASWLVWLTGAWWGTRFPRPNVGHKQ